MDVVKQLIQYVTRGFCELRSILIMDAILLHGVLTEDDLHNLLGIPRREIRQLCAALKEDRLLTDHVQKQEGHAQRQISKNYYYVHFTETIDAIKWKVHSIETKLKEQMGADAQGSGYVCTVCGTKYSSLDVASLYNPMSNGFVCDVCGGEVAVDTAAAANQVNQEKLGALMSQIKPIIDALRKIDDIHVPENTFQSSLAEAVPPPAPPTAGQTPTQTPTPPKMDRPGAKTNGSTTALHVNITSDKERAEMEQQARDEKARLAEQNALPAWHVQSTVGKVFNADSDSTVLAAEETSAAMAEEEKPTITETAEAESKPDEDAVAAYYRQLEMQRAREEDDEEEEEEDEEEDDDDDDDEAEFEDVA